ncbi:MarR family transcriptional regulator for hemolysin [Rhizobium petrolearium]|uniref:MarR family transcriptional regulator n=2 Tax=Neorhizobium TaxID=1525371 RepID=A0ABV0MD83_9HYPH|nr:MarR family transcriptional regulator [Neorhizobium petrolearium]MBP1848384.1 MarR family transcriptional regulator for hemolysin [Neorhizobium petrolearium]MCC2614497.1 MarR family transcriptional regulator [Neorhizobium petrolearium]WGI72258.1 MarR family transcriptional regulator [Neorhizobium petrolearium]
MNHDPITSEFLESLTKASRKIRTAFNQRVAAHGLTYPRARTLFRLAKQNMTQSELACDLELEQATIVRILDRMEETGLVERRPDGKDRRINLIVLTPLGEEQAALVRSVGEDLRMQIFANVDPKELQNGIALLERIAANVAEMSDIHVPA